MTSSLNTPMIYNPLRPSTALYEEYVSATRVEAPATDNGELIKFYRSHVVSVDQGVWLEEDARRLVTQFRSFFPSILRMSDLREGVANLPLVFPSIAVPDARTIEDGAHRAVFVTSGMLNAIELFSATISICARLHELAIPILSKYEDNPPKKVPLAWVTLTGDSIPLLDVSSLLAQSFSTDDELCLHIVESSRVGPSDLWPAATRYTLSRYLVQLMMRALRNTATSSPHALAAYKFNKPLTASPIDADYLAALALAFTVLHEIGHLALRHNEIGYRGTAGEVSLADSIITAAAGVDKDASDRSIRVANLVGTGSSFEFAADNFAIGILNDNVREAMLEAASLWCAALERANVVEGNRFKDLIRMNESPESHPSFALRVWNLNGRFSSGWRQGELARSVATAAEEAAYEWDRGSYQPEREASAFRTLWQLAVQATDDSWTPAPRAVSKPEASQPADLSSVLTAGLLSWEADERERAEGYFREAAASDDVEISRQAHRLIGRMREEADDLSGAEEFYRMADKMGDMDAPNELGLLFKRRGLHDEAESAFARADERGSAFGAYNLSHELRARNELEMASAALDRADARGYAQAALLVGEYAYEAMQLDRAEAAWRRAQERGAADVSARLGYLLYQRGDSEGAAAVWNRGAAQGDLDAMHNLGILHAEEGQIVAAWRAWQDAVQHGRRSSVTNLVSLRPRLRQLRRQVKVLRRRAKRGNAQAAFDLGQLLARCGDINGAVAGLELAERLGNSRAASELGTLLARRGDSIGAEEAYRRGAGENDPRAIYNLGVELSERGDYDAAIVLWRKADELGEPHSAYNLGNMVESTGDLNGAANLFQRAEELGDTLGAVRFGRILEEKHDIAAAELAYRRADEKGDPYGAAALGDLLHTRGDEKGAVDGWRRADKRGHPDAAYNVGFAARRRGDLDEAEAALRRALERGNSRARRDLAFLMAQKGHQKEATSLLMSGI
jgi:tetratricopeptide (TPR) repeat protein